MAGVRKPRENVSINLDKVYKNALQATKKYTNIEIIIYLILPRHGNRRSMAREDASGVDMVQEM